MINDSPEILDTIVNTLLQVGERVAEVSKDCLITKMWDRNGTNLNFKQEEYLGKKVSDFFGNAVFLQCENKIIETFSTGKNTYIEYVTLYNEKPRSYGLKFLNCHPDKNYLLVLIEILNKQTEIKLVEDKWKLALDAAGDGMWDLDLETDKISFSDKWWEIFGYEQDEIKTYKQWIANVHPEDSNNIYVKKIEKHLYSDKHVYSNEYRYKCKDGTYKWILSRGVVILKSIDGKPLRLIGIHTDITQLKNAEEKHKTTEEFLFNLLNNIQDGILVTDENQNIIFTNINFSKKYPDDIETNLLGKSMWERLEFSKTHHKDPEGFIKRVVEILDKKEKVLDEELYLNDGRIQKRDFLPLFINNKFKGEIWQFRDITEFKNTEKRFEEQRYFYEQILDSLEVDIAVFDADFRYLFLNKKAINDDNLRKWMIGKDDDEYITYRNKPIEIAIKRKENLKKAVEEKRIIEFEEKIPFQNGENIYFLRRIYPVFNKNGKMEFILGYGIKITDLVIAREELKTSMNTFSSAFENSGIGMALVGIAGNWLNVNKEVCKITGYSKEELLLLTFQDITHPDDLDADINLVGQMLRKEIHSYHLEKRYITKNKNIVWVLLTVSLVWKSEAEPNFFIAQIMDITKKKQLEKEIEEQRYFYESTLNNLPADIAVFAPDHRYLFVNKNAFKNEELRKWMIGKTDIDYAKYSNRPDSFVKDRFALYEKAEKERKETRMIERLVDKQGTVSHHLRLLRPIFNDDGAFEFIVAYGINVTELIEAQEALKTSMETFTNAFSNSGVGMALISPEGNWLDVNKVLCDISGYTKEELQQITYKDMSYYEDVDIDAELINQLFERKIESYSIEKRYVTKDKKILMIYLTVSSVWNTDGTPKFFIAQIIDITAKKELENNLAIQNKTLEAIRVSLVNKVTQLEELNRIIAHNLRGPANNIKMLAGVLKAKNNMGGDAEQTAMSEAFSMKEAIEFIDESSNSLNNSLSTLMEIAQIQLNKEIPLDNCDIATIINDITKQLQGSIFEKKAVIIKNFEIDKIQYPKIYLESICYNFISNALKYSRKDVTPEIVISTKLINNKIKIIFKDNGLGINMAKYGNKVFKLNQVFHTGYDSKGVGLYITKTQVESMGGTIEVKSKVNEGSEFIVTL